MTPERIEELRHAYRHATTTTQMDLAECLDEIGALRAALAACRDVLETRRTCVRCQCLLVPSSVAPRCEDGCSIDDDAEGDAWEREQAFETSAVAVYERACQNAAAALGDARPPDPGGEPALEGTKATTIYAIPHPIRGRRRTR